MPEYLDDPSVLTKDKLKSELLAHHVELPAGNPTKDVFVQLYLKNLTALNKHKPALTAVALDAFSSDEELPPPPVVAAGRSRSSGRKSTRKTEKVQPDPDVTAFTDEALREELLKQGVDVGPIVASTRGLYEKKLQRLLDSGPAAPPPADGPANHNGSAEPDVYSDKEDEVTSVPEPEPVTVPEPEPVPVVDRPLRSRAKTPVTTRTRSSQHQKKEHPTHLESYTQHTSAALKRKSSTEGSLASPSKQTKLWDTQRVSQTSVDRAVLKFVVQGLHPSHIVQQQGFIDLVQHLQPNTNVMTRNTVVDKISKASAEMKTNLKAAFSEIEFIATTTDCWTAYRRGFIGVTAHWFNPQTMQRSCAALACKHLKGPHTFSALAGALNDIHTEYNIREKIVRTTTDNGSNFLKAFRVYGQTEEDNNPEPVGEGDGEEHDGGQNDDDEEEESAEGVEFVDTGALLDEDDYLEYQLPKHHRCACHLLNLVSTVDASKAEFNPLYKRVSRSTFAKCSSLWNKSSRSTTACQVIEDHCKLQLVRPVATRWNSLFSAVEGIVRITKEQGEGALAAVCSELDTPKFTPVELAFLAEYAKTMSPVAKALDVLQGETSVQMGWLVPTITLLRTKLQHLQVTSKFCEPLIAALVSGLEKRFGEMLADPELIAAAILVPKFKTCWTSDENILKLGLDYIRSHLDCQAENHVSEGSHSSEEEDFFSSLKTGPVETTQQLDAYLGCPGDTVELLKSFPAVCQLSLKLNTALPASAACGSVAGLIFRSRRACIGSKNFENQLLLRLNQAYW